MTGDATAVPGCCPYDLVVIGASAGGVQALLAILGVLPANFAVPILIVLHIAPERPSGLVSLFAAHCKLSVSEALDKQPIDAGNVIFAPPGYHMLVEPDRRIALSLDEPVMFSRPAIDPTFESAALAHRERLLAIVLTGASQDGSAGAACVREHGGTVWIQDPATAHAPAMPEAALRRAGCDELLPLPRIGPKLAAWTR